MVTQVASCTKCLVLVERYLSGREYCIAVMGAGAAGAVAFSPVERCLEEDEKVCCLPFTSLERTLPTCMQVSVTIEAAVYDYCHGNLRLATTTCKLFQPDQLQWDSSTASIGRSSWDHPALHLVSLAA